MAHRTLLVATVLLLAVVASSLAAPPSEQHHWPQWRGPLGTGEAPSADPPLDLSARESLAWKREIPGRGHGTPVVWDDRIFVVTAVATGKAAPKAEGEAEESDDDTSRGGWRPPSNQPTEVLAFRLLAFDRHTGKPLWERTVREEVPHEGTHTHGSWASASPVTDGKRIFAHFGSRGLYAFTLDGEPLWDRDFGDMATRNGFGEGSSPALAEDTLVVSWDHEGESALIAVDASTGKTRWSIERDEITSWSTPLIVEHGGKQQVVVAATGFTRGYDLKSGKELWRSAGMTVNTIPTPVTDGDLVFVTSGFRGNALQAIRLAAAKGDITDSEAIAWSFDRDTPYVPSPLLYRGNLYVLKHNKGILSVFDADTGERRFGPERLEALAEVYASPVAASGRVYIAGRDGAVTVLRAGDKLEVLASHQLDDGFDASPVIVGDTLYLRGRQYLYAFARPEPPAAEKKAATKTTTPSSGER